MKTCRVRRTRPSVLALALALAMTMLIVYLASVSARDSSEESVRNVQTASLESGSAEVRLNGMETRFLADCVCADELSARVSAAKCAQSGGAGFILLTQNGYAVIREADADAADAILLRADGLTLRLTGRARDVAAVSSAAEFLYGQAAQTGALANAMDADETDAESVRALLNVYRTQGRASAEELNAVSDGGEAVSRMRAGVNCALERIESAIRETTPAKMRLIHAAGCAEWISLLNDLSEL